MVLDNGVSLLLCESSLYYCTEKVRMMFNNM